MTARRRARLTEAPRRDRAAGVDRLEGRLLERLGDDDQGGRVFAVRIIEAGMSLNGRHYPEAVLHAAAPLYEAAQAFDHHRTDEELGTGTVRGLVGYYRNVRQAEGGLDADLHVLPSAGHIAEALDISVDHIGQGLPPLVGLSHDVMADTREAVVDGARVEEATAIRRVLSADVVAVAAAGGRATRILAGGVADEDHSNPPTSGDPVMTLAELLALLRGAAPAERASLIEQNRATWEGAGLTVDDVTRLAGDPDPDPVHDEPGDGDGAGHDDGEGGGNGDGPDDRQLVGAGVTAGGTLAEARHARESIMGRVVIERAVAEAGLPAGLVDTVARQLPAAFTETEARQHLRMVAGMRQALEANGLEPRVRVPAGGDSAERRAERVYQMLCGNFREGYRSLRQAFAEVTGLDRVDFLDGDLPAMILRESYANGPRQGLSTRMRESIDSNTWGQVLGDSIHRRLLDVYRSPNYGAWRDVVSSVVPRNDFRTNRLTRMGGYGTLPGVPEGAPYQPLASPPDEEATYAITKRGGTEDLTLETIANDDMRAVQRIPMALGRSAAMTLFRHVMDYFPGNPVVYDALNLFDAGHVNTDANALSQTALATGRRKMRDQASYGVAQDILGITPRLLLVPNDLEELAFQLTTSGVAITGTQDATVPNINNATNLTYRVVDYWTSGTGWFLVADTGTVDTIEVGFYQGREEPELFVQDDPRVGAVFDSDRITYKIRHIYGTAVIDYRGFYRGNS